MKPKHDAPLVELAPLIELIHCVSRGLGRLLNARLKDIALGLGLTTIVVCSKQQRQEFWCKPSIGYTRVFDLLCTCP